MQQRITTPNNRSITCLDWASVGIFLVSSTSCWLHKTAASDDNDLNTVDANPCLELTTAPEILKVTSLTNSPEKVALVCQNGKTRIYDINTEKLVTFLGDHKSTVADCKAK